MPETPTIEKTASELQGDLEMLLRNKKAVKAMKLFAELLLSLPDDFGGVLDQVKLDELAEPRTQDLYKKLKAENFPIEVIKVGVDFATIFAEVTIRSCERYTRNVLRNVYHDLLGYYEPDKEM